MWPYFYIRDELVVQDGLILKGDRLVVPKALRKHMMEETAWQPPKSRVHAKESQGNHILAKPESGAKRLHKQVWHLLCHRSKTKQRNANKPRHPRLPMSQNSHQFVWTWEQKLPGPRGLFFKLFLKLIACTAQGRFQKFFENRGAQKL